MLFEGSVVRIPFRIGRKVGRPGVVLQLFVLDGHQLAVVPWGTGTLRPRQRHVAVVPREAAGRALGLVKPTYFYGMNAWVGRVERLGRQRAGVCPGYLFAALRSLVPLK